MHEAVQALIIHECLLRVTIRIVGNYLREWGFTVQHVRRAAYEQNHAVVERLLTEEYSVLQRRTKADKALIYWGHEIGVLG